MLLKGVVAPDFSALNQNGEEIKLSDFRGQWVLLYFYPKDNTPGCTKEACSLRDSHYQFRQAGGVVIGVSSDSVDSHGRFATKYELPFSIISDSKKLIIKAYEAGGLFSRVSYLIDPQGFIAKGYSKVNPSQHAEEVLKDLKELQK